MFKLVIQDDEGKTTIVPLIRDEITIGRKEGNTIRLTERNVSRRHARILRNNGEVQIEDLGSYNGIRVNNARIAERVSLRVSDQVQIGDYKLYLKAEGVEQVDEARTMPIERLDAVAPTDQHAAVAPTPTAPIPVQTPSPQLVGNPNRTLVAIADTDPQGRPVATAAAVAALTQPVGYGKLVVLSSNFAGKEFELSRPQMIVGRTDENDIVINHRSISRNHAKLVREPDTGRYTVSDLQSSNGVRVNGQDYGKVELRRGDVVDLGHVRLRFIEPGEDFVFTRDAVITDVPDGGGRRGLLVAIIVGILLLGGVAVVFLTRNSGPDKKDDPVVNPDIQGSQGSGSDKVAIGSDKSTNPELVIDAGSAAATNPPKDDEKQVRIDCLRAAEAQKWDDLNSCSERYKEFDQAQAKKFYEQAVSERTADLAQTDMREALRAGDYHKAKRHLDSIKDSSSYYAAASKLYNDEDAKVVADYTRQAEARKKDCAYLNILKGQAAAKTDGAAAAVQRVIAKCAVTVPPPPSDDEKLKKEIEGAKARAGALVGGHDCDGAKKYLGAQKDAVADAIRSLVESCKPAVVAAPCDAGTLHQEGQDAFTNGTFAVALAKFEAAYKCKQDGSLVRLMYMAACRSHSFAKAKGYLGMNPQAQQVSLARICLQEGFDPLKP